MLKDMWRHFTTDASYFRPYVEMKNNEGERKVCMKWIQFRSWFRRSGAKVSRLIIQKFSRCFSLPFNVSVDVVRMFLSCSMIMIFPWLQINNKAAFAVDSMVDFKRFAGFITFECCCWNKLLTKKATWWIAWDTLSCMTINFSFNKFLVVMDGISANDVLVLVPFLKAIMGSVLKVSLQFWFACNMYQCFVIISFKFGNDRLCYW